MTMDLRIFTEPQQGASYADQLALARRAEECGFSAYFRSDHYLKMGDVSGLPGPTDSWVTLAGLALQTSTIRLGTLVTSATFRHPGPLAISVAQVDEMSGGRVELGLGTGWFEAEHQAYGLEFPDLRTRFDRFEEQLAVVTGLWRTPVGETFSFSGSHYTVVDSPALPKPSSPDGPPIIVGGHGKKRTPQLAVVTGLWRTPVGETFSFSGSHYTVVDSPALPKPSSPDGPPIIVGGHGKKRTPQLAARYAAEFNVGFSPVDVTGDLFGRATEACEAVGRAPDSLVRSAALTVVCGRDDAEVRRRAEAAGRDLDELRRDAVVGTPAECVETLGRYASVGTERTYLQVLDFGDLDHLDLIAAEVMPHV